MISWHDLYTVLSAVVPLYVAMILAYGSVRWWNVFTPDQCSGINRFVAFFAVPLLSFRFISTSNPYDMNLRFIAADTLQKITILVILFFWTKFTKYGRLDWMITIFSLSTLPNTLIMGIPLLIAMYGDYAGDLMVQIVVLQCIIWYTFLLFLFEFRGAKLLITEQFPENASSISSIKVENDVVSLDGHDHLETDAEIGNDGKVHVTLRKSNASRRSNDIYSVQSPRQSNSDENYGPVDCGLNSGPDLLNAVQLDQSDEGAHESRMSVNNYSPRNERSREKSSFDGGGDRARNVENEGAVGLQRQGSEARAKEPIMPPARVVTRLILVTVWRKLIRNPNSYASLIGLIWSLVSYRWDFPMPKIIDNSISILSNAGLGMAMFSLGLFMALQPKMMACGNSLATFAMAVRFLSGPAVMAVASAAVGLRGNLLRIAIVQAALPQGIVPFVFAKEYNVFPAVLSTLVIFGMLIALPIALLYYVVLGL